MKKVKNQSLLNLSIPIILILAIVAFGSLAINHWITDQNLKWSTISGLTSVCSLGLAAYLAFIVVIKFVQSSKKPALRLIFTNSNSESMTIKYNKEKVIINLELAVINDGDAVAIWFEVIVDLTNIPFNLLPSVAPEWAQREGHYKSTYNQYTVQCAAKAAAFTTVPLDVGTIQMESRILDEHEGKYEIPYKINGDWGVPKKDSLWITLVRDQQNGKK